MPLTAEELITKSIDQRKRKRYDEALVSAMAATDIEPDSANSWWQVSLCRMALGDNRGAAPALRKTVELAPGFGAGWASLGTSLTDIGEFEAAQRAFETALKCDPDNLEALEALSALYAAENAPEKRDAELQILVRIEELSALSSTQANRLGILHYRNKHFYDAIKYWQHSAAHSTHPASLFNLGLAYSHEEVSQDADAVDMWRLTSLRFPEYQPAKEKLSQALPRLLELARTARLQCETVLPDDQWYSQYLNPFELLDSPDDMSVDDFDTKVLQKLRKALLREIELEDGSVSWMPGINIDKSRAIGVCDELNDDIKRTYHWQVFRNKPLMAFLGKGSHEHFLVSESGSPLETIELLDDLENGFLGWLSDAFAPQFDRVLSKAIASKNLVILECLLDGRRWVSSSHADACFENARRLIDRMLEPLRELHKRSGKEKVAVNVINDLLDRHALVGILNVLPPYFQDYQNDALAQIRGMAINCFNIQNDSELSRNVLMLTKLFRFKSADLNSQLAEDFEKIEELIREERKHEAKLTSGSDKWEITKEGARLGDRLLRPTEVSSVRWGILISRKQAGTIYDFLFDVCADDGRNIRYHWTASKEVERNQKFFSDLINAAHNYLFPSILERIEYRLARGQHLRIGTCSVSTTGVEFPVKGWIFTDTHLVPWNRLLVGVENGDIVVQDATSLNIKTTFSLRETENAPVLRYLAIIKNPREG